MSNIGACRRLGDGPDTVDLCESQPGDTSTLGGGLLILGHAHGVSATDLFLRGLLPSALRLKKIKPSSDTSRLCHPARNRRRQL